MSVTGWVIGYVTSKSARRFEKASQDPVGTQERKLLSLVRNNAETEYGKRYGFESIRSIADYQRQVPIINYESIRQDVDRILAGESGILTAEDPVMFAQTSGTTGEPKFIPVTPTCQGQDHKDVMRTWLSHAHKDHPSIFTGKIVSMVSPAIEGHAASGLPYGSTSGHMYRNQPWVIRRAYPIPYEAFEIGDYLAKYYTILRLGVAEDVHFMCTANPSSILKMCQKANEYSEQIVRDVRDGTLSTAFNMSARIRQAIEGGLRPNPTQAKVLEDGMARRGGRMLPGDYWPNLALIGCWKGGTVGHYVDRFDEWFNPDRTRSVPVRDWGYLSSEGRCSIPLSDTGSEGALTIAANFFEFVPVEELEANPDDSSSWSFRTVGELQDGAEYYIFITTSAGLYRYDINDVVRVEGKYNQVPQVVFVRKGRGMTNITGEKLSVNQVILAFQETARKTGMIPSHFKAEADIDASRYIMMVEFAAERSKQQHREFLSALDDEFKSINIEYKAKRDSMRLAAPVLRVMREGWYERSRQHLADSGKRVFQAKTILLSVRQGEGDSIDKETASLVELTEE